jgi:hypothetical protein
MVDTREDLPTTWPSQFRDLPSVNRDEFKIFTDLCNGTKRAASWTPLLMHLIRNDEGKKLKEADSPWLGSYVLILRPRAVAALTPLLLDYGELLPLRCPGTELRLYNVTNIVPALDEAASTIDRFPDGRIMMVRRPVFHKHIIGSNDIFKLSRRPGEPIYVSQRVVDQWHSAKLTGIEFRHKWSSQ